MSQDSNRVSSASGHPCIGVFDSGFGGLTVLRSLLARLPSAEFFYLGDTARLPYGSKSRTTIARYAVESAQLLEGFGAEYLVIACNTASALALDAIGSAAQVPVLGVIEAGADAAAAASGNREALVLATEATVRSHAYREACFARGLRAIEKACPLLVPLIEEGWTGLEPEDVERAEITRQILRVYLQEAFEDAVSHGLRPDTLLLGCTHYPLLRAMLEEEVPATMTILDSAETTAHRVWERFGGERSSNVAEESMAEPPVHGLSRCHFFATDSVEKFRTLGSRFLGQEIDQVEQIDLGG